VAANAVPAAGPVGIQDLADVFGGIPPHRMGEYYLDGGIVPIRSYHPNTIPSAGVISLNDFRGAYPYIDAGGNIFVGKRQNATGTPSTTGWHYGYRSSLGGCRDTFGSLTGSDGYTNPCGITYRLVSWIDVPRSSWDVDWLDLFETNVPYSLLEYAP
jgi:hypothetical protein